MVRKSGFMLGVSSLALVLLPGIASAQTDTSSSPASVSDSSDTQDNEIVVQGFRKSLETAQTIKKDSDQIIDSVVAEDIGKLPDATGAETLARVPGVSVERAQGEAAGIRVRGLPDLTTTYNGREIFTADGRSVALQDFPSDTISRFDVYKTSAANLIEPGIAGAVDVRSRKPFDFKDFRIAGGATELYWRNSKQFGFEGSLLVSKRWTTGIGEIGILVEGSYTDNNFTDAYRTDATTIQRRVCTATNQDCRRYPAAVQYDQSTSRRFRPSADAQLQWRPSSNLEIYGDFIFQGFRGRADSRSLSVMAGSNAVLSNVTMCPGSTTLICKATMTGLNAPTQYASGQFSGTNSYQGGGGFIWKIGGARIVGDLAYTQSRFTSTNTQLNSTTNSTGTRVFDFDNEDVGGGVAAITDINLSDAKSWRLLSYIDLGSQTFGKSWQGRLDADIPIHVAIFDKIQTGVRWSDRDTTASAYTNGTFTFPTATAAQLAALQFTAIPLQLQMAPPSFPDGSGALIQTWIGPTRQSVIHYADYLRTLAGKPLGYPARIPTYFSNEKSYAAYFQLHYGFDLANMPVDGQIGIRAVRTLDDIAGTLTIGSAAGTPYAKSNRYNDYLPNVSARIKLTSKLQARLAYTMTRTRPAFGSLNPTITVSASSICDNSVTPPVCYRTASGGNPNLQPIESKNYDASLEYYFSRSGSVTVQVFRRDVTGFINNTTTIVNDPDLGNLQINRPENGQKGRIQGVEAGFRSFLKIASLPQWMQNFGVLGNVTYLDHCSELSPTAAATLPGCQPITNTSKLLYNAQVFYENQFISLRASYNYRSKYQTYSIVTDPAVTAQATLPTTVFGRGVLDLSASINPTPAITLAANWANVLGNPQRLRRQFNVAGDSYPYQTQYLESTMRFSMRFRF